MPIITYNKIENNTYFITVPKYAGFSRCAFYKDTSGRLTRLWDASYVEGLVKEDTDCEIVTKEVAIKHAKEMWK